LFSKKSYHVSYFDYFILMTTFASEYLHCISYVYSTQPIWNSANFCVNTPSYCLHAKNFCVKMQESQDLLLDDPEKLLQKRPGKYAALVFSRKKNVSLLISQTMTVS